MTTATKVRAPQIITYEVAKTLLERAVEEKGEDYVFRPRNDNGYWYFNPEDGTPGCIVGHVLHYKGITVEDIGELNVACGVGMLKDHGVIEADSQTMDLLENAQTEQDQGETWSNAVKDAVDFAEFAHAS